MEWLWAAVGAIMLAAAAVDALWTTLWTDGGGGPMTSRVSHGAWALLTRSPPAVRRRVQGLAGPLVLLLVVGTWVMLLVGWWLVFLAGRDAVVDATTGRPAGAVTRLYYVGFNVFTLGIGDYTPDGNVWQLLTAARAGSGLFLITLAITYLVQVLSAVVDKRSFASAVTALGTRPHEVVLTTWDSGGFPALALHLSSLGSSLGTLTEQHLAYPVLHFFHTPDEDKASSLAVAILDEALTLLTSAMPHGAAPPPAAVEPVQRVIGSYLETLVTAMPEDPGDAPRPPEVGALREAGLPTVNDRTFAAALVPLTERRRRLGLLVSTDGWDWP